MQDADRKMFAPLRRGEAISPESKVVAVLAAHASAATPATIADRMLCGGLAVGTRGPVTKRIVEMLDHLEEMGKVERVPDGRYRAVRPSR